MSKIVVSDSFAVKYRPQKLEDMIGNDVAKAAVSGMLARKTFPNTLLLHGGTGMGKCLVGSTLVNTSAGMKRLDSLVSNSDTGFSEYRGPSVANIFGKFEMPSRAFKKVAESTIVLKTKFGIIEGTPEHPMFGLIDGELGYHRLDEYCTGDSLAVPKILHHPTCSITNQVRPNYFHFGKNISQYEKQNPSEATANAIRNGFEPDLFLPINAYEFMRGLLSQTPEAPQVLLPTQKLAKQTKELFMIWNIRSTVKNCKVSFAEDQFEVFLLFGYCATKEPSFLTRYVKKIKQLEQDTPFCVQEEEHVRTLQRFTKIEEVQKNDEPKIVYDLSMPSSHSFLTECLISHNTTMARMLGRYANCDTGDSCGTCPSCLSGESNPDILEMNMATDRGIDEVRSLIQKSKLAPRFNKRVFILDELHQCFTENTAVLMADGTEKNISEILVGDKVLSYNHQSKNNTNAVVSAVTFKNTNKPIVEVVCKNGSVTCTHDHLWWNESKKEYTKAAYLKPDDTLLTPSGTTKVIGVSLFDTKLPKVFDITVPKNSNFYVKTGITKNLDPEYALVHNCTPQAKEALLKPLEEPAKNTMWILCTTEPEKLTKTILGRCQQISMSAPSQKEMVKYLRQVCRSENVKVTEERLPILQYIAEASMGHSRNAIQSLETFVNLVEGNKEFSIEKIKSLLTSSSGGDNDELAAHLLAYVLKGEGKEAVKLMYQAGQNKDVMGIIFKMRWLIDYKINNWAGMTKFNPHINQIFEKKFGKNSVNVSHLIKILGSLVDCEIKIKTVSGLDDRIYFTSKILNDMLDIVK